MGYPPSTLSEFASQSNNRIARMITLYATILQIKSSSPLMVGYRQLTISTPIVTTPYPFQFPRLWTLLARIGSSNLLSDKAAPQIICALLETAGDRLLEVYGVQAWKMLKTIESRCLLGDFEDWTGEKDVEVTIERERLLDLLLRIRMRHGKPTSPPPFYLNQLSEF